MSRMPYIAPMRLARRLSPSTILIGFTKSNLMASVRSHTSKRENAVSFRAGVTSTNHSMNSAPRLQITFCNEAVLDGEIVCLDQYGRSQFKELMFRRGEPFF